MARIREAVILACMGACSSLLYYTPVRADEPAARQQAEPGQNVPQPSGAPGAPQKLMVTVGKALIIDSPLNIMRVHVANGELAEAVAVNPREVLINGRLPGETSLIVWQQNGSRLVYDLAIRVNTLKLDAARQQIARDFPGDEINLTFENDTAFVRGRVKDVNSAERVMAIASTLGKAVNLLRVEIPPVEPQILLRVRFANVDRSATTDLGLNLFNGSFNQQTSLGTGPALYPNESGRFSVSQAVNVLLLRPDINLAVELQALQAKRALELLAEPNLLAISGEQASFLAGGEFPFPVVQTGGGSGNAITLMWREYGVRLNFMPNVTPRGTIRLKVAPEVSSLDYTNAVSVAGVTVPGIASRRVQTEVELESGQTFVIAGLLDNQSRENFSKVPGIGDIPVLGKLFQSKSVSRSNSELLVIITPELVRPIPAGQAVPELKMPLTFLEPNSAPPNHPGMDKTGPVPVKPPADTVPFEQLVQPKRQELMPPSGNPMQAIPPPAPPPASASAAMKPQ